MGASVMDILANAPLRQRAALDQSALVRAETQAEAARTPLIQQQTQAAQLQNQLAQQQLKDAQIFRDAYAANPDGDPAKLRITCCGTVSADPASFSGSSTTWTCCRSRRT
jgi:hypothetical protein